MQRKSNDFPFGANKYVARSFYKAVVRVLRKQSTQYMSSS